MKLTKSLLTSMLAIGLINCTKNHQSEADAVDSRPEFSISTSEELGIESYAYPGDWGMLTNNKLVANQNSAFYLIPNGTGGYEPTQVIFKLDSKNAVISKVRWLIGADPAIREGLSIGVDFFNPTGSIQYKCLVTYRDGSDPFNLVDKTDTLKKMLTISPLPTWNFTYLGSLTDNPQDTFRVNMSYGVELNWPSNNVNPVYKINGLPKGYSYSIPAFPKSTGAGFRGVNGYPPAYVANGNTFIRDPFGTALFRNDFDSVQIYFSYGTTTQSGYWGAGSQVWNKVFTGKRVL